jgi:transcription termination/antitermination protein NusA
MRHTTLPDDPDGRIAALFAREVPEIASGVVSIRALARLPGVRTKIAVESGDPAVDALGACMGPEGSRIFRIVDALDGEKIDVMPWSPEPERMIRYALAPLRVTSITLEPPTRRALITAVNLYRFVQRHGPEHPELASRLSGWDIAILGEPPNPPARAHRLL